MSISVMTLLMNNEHTQTHLNTDRKSLKTKYLSLRSTI